VYPICPWQRTPTSVHIDTSVLGTAFFISGDGGIFVTARHVVEEYLDRVSTLRILHVDDPPTRFLELHVIGLQVHPDYDVAVGRVHVPPDLFIQHLKLVEGELAPGERVSIFGYSRTTATDRPAVEDGALPGLHLAMDPQFYLGAIDKLHPSGFGLARGPVYVHTAETIGGISGGPLLRLADSGVYGITSTGSVLYGTATDVRVLLDWPLTFLDNKTLRQLAQESQAEPQPS